MRRERGAFLGLTSPLAGSRAEAASAASEPSASRRLGNFSPLGTRRRGSSLAVLGCPSALHDRTPPSSPRRTSWSPGVPLFRRSSPRERSRLRVTLRANFLLHRRSFVDARGNGTFPSKLVEVLERPSTLDSKSASLTSTHRGRRSSDGCIPDGVLRRSLSTASDA